jgi:predicted metal-dependent phosphoesterase TrpH
VIGLYLRERLPKGTPAVDTCARIQEQGGLVYLPHPFARGKGGAGAHVERLVPHLDVIEVFNGRLRPSSLNARAERVASAEGLLRGAGSDAHTLGEVARSYVEVPWHPNRADELARALRQARVVGSTSHPAVHLASTWAKVRKKLPW